ncbi:hypothetical protein [Flavobacterium sp. UBA6046]|uniref:hypothetical protein n=1 Tax=Flavobacterium sp. UBA6046 TaxID=1946552 RepID=UPI0025B92F4E|nr:hypothetical protein [Flavobacterium sp. UBA6046]
MTERGFSDEELERQLQEEEKALEQQEPAQETAPAPEATIEASHEQLEKEIDLESSKAETNAKTLETNLAAVGGKEGFEKTWSTMDSQKKEAIMKRIKDHAMDREMGIDTQKFGFYFVNPIENWNDADDTGIFRLPIATMMTLMSPIFVATFGISGGIDRVISSVRMNKEKRNLSKLEQKYAA